MCSVFCNNLIYRNVFLFCAPRSKFVEIRVQYSAHQLPRIRRFSQHHPYQAPVGYEDGGLGILVGLQWYPVLPAYAAAVCRIAYGQQGDPLGGRRAVLRRQRGFGTGLLGPVPDGLHVDRRLDDGPSPVAPDGKVKTQFETVVKECLVEGAVDFGRPVSRVRRACGSQVRSRRRGCLQRWKRR